jgi:hypothetical protein
MDMDTTQPIESRTAKSIWLTEGLLIAGAPVAAYVLALVYINGYADYFQIPMEFLSLNVTTMFVVGGKILFLAFLVYLFVMLPLHFLPAADSPFVNRSLVILPWAALLCIKVMFFGRRWQEWRSTLFYFLLMVAYFFLLPLIYRDKGSYMEKLREDDRRFHSARTTVAHKLLTSDRGRRIIIYYIWIWFSLSAAQNAGRFEAMWKKEFLVPASRPESVILSTFGDNMIVAPFDRKTKEVERSFSILKKGEDPNLLLRWEMVGPLQVRIQPTIDSQPSPTAAPPIKPGEKQRT